MLPNDLRGEWIWNKNHVNALDPYLFLRRDFTLDETPVSAELLISARSFFHLFINGRHVCFGPGSSPNRDAYVMRLDIAFLIETGINIIGVLVHNTQVPRLYGRKQPGGFWCQLNINEKPLLWSSSDWLINDAVCYAANRPRTSLSGGFIEKIDFRLYPENWEQKSFDHFGWQNPDYAVPLSEDPGRLIELELPQIDFVPVHFSSIVQRGYCQQQYPITHVSFAELAQRRGSGVYIAETYYDANLTGKSELDIYSDNPYRLFINGILVKEKGVTPVPAGSDLNSLNSSRSMRADFSGTLCEVDWGKGWNHIYLAQQVETGSSGITLVFKREHGDIHLQRDTENESKLGWNTYGPLQAPLANILRTFTADRYEPTAFAPGLESASDEAAALMAIDFTSILKIKDKEDVEPAPPEITLEQGQYVILDLGRIVYGCPDLHISGSDGDIIDIVCGENIKDGRVLPYDEHGRHVDTIILGPDEVRWLAFAPRGLRYLMLVVKESGSDIKIRNYSVKCRNYNWDNKGSFESSEELLNFIWKVSHDTLETTVQDVFFDAAGGSHAQRLADTMLQAFTAYYVFGDTKIAEKSLREFTLQQFETGEMLTVCPTDFYISRADEALLWPIWLQRHFYHSGEIAVIKKMLPALKRLVSYFEKLIDKELGVLILPSATANSESIFAVVEDAADDAVCTGLNAVFCKALVCASSLFEFCEMPDDAEKYHNLAGTVARNIRDLTWNSKKNLFTDSVRRGRKSSSYSWLTNVLALYGGIAKPEWFDTVFDNIFMEHAPYYKEPTGNESNPLLKYFIAETAFAINRRTWAVNFICNFWGRMVEEGNANWWQKLIENHGATEDVCSHCYGASSFPAAYLSSEVVGIRPAEPGFTAVYFNPLVEMVESLNAQIPTPYGHIYIEWQTGDEGKVDMFIDANYPVQMLPVFSQQLQEKIVLHLTESVNLLGTEEQPAG